MTEGHRSPPQNCHLGFQNSKLIYLLTALSKIDGSWKMKEFRTKRHPWSRKNQHSLQINLRLSPLLLLPPPSSSHSKLKAHSPEHAKVITSPRQNDQKGQHSEFSIKLIQRHFYLETACFHRSHKMYLRADADNIYSRSFY